MKNSIIQLLNDKGYSNTGDNRNYVIKSLNGLINIGLVDLYILDKEVYKTRSFVYNVGDKTKTTAYKIKMYDKLYFGHWMPKKQINSCFGEKYLTDIEYNYINLYDVLCKIANIININKNGFDFIKNGNCDCAKCKGSGFIPEFAHYAQGVCFDCAGTGIEKNVLQKYIKNNINQSGK